MGARGKPTRIKELAGTLQPCRTNPNEPEPDASIPDAPIYVTGSALDEWQRITTELEPLGVVSQLDMAVMAAYCCAYGEMADATIEWQGKGAPMTTESANGIEMVHPLLTIISQRREQTRKIASEIGLTPASRKNVSGKKKSPTKESKWAI